MGLLKVGAGAAGGVLADSWRAYFSCESLDADTLVAKGIKRADRRSPNTQEAENIVSDGSIITVKDGQCMIIVEQGEIVEVCAEPGDFIFDASAEPTIFYGKLSEKTGESFSKMSKRFTLSGKPTKDQLIYFFNTKEMPGNTYETDSAIPFHIADANLGRDTDIALHCNGEYSYRLADPILFYKNVCGDIEDAYTRNLIDAQLTSEVLAALRPALAKLSDMGIRYSAIPEHSSKLTDALNDVLSNKWRETRGTEIAMFTINLISAAQEAEKETEFQQSAGTMRGSKMAAADITAAQSADLSNPHRERRAARAN
ncbi:MAG: SPFH domain-containing protein [Eggerthellaceae bacterium]|jgi:membrane protease subunit (stomatin/prohibitin family)